MPTQPVAAMHTRQSRRLKLNAGNGHRSWEGCNGVTVAELRTMNAVSLTDPKRVSFCLLGNLSPSQPSRRT